jgi:putative ABC transport system permease protein
MSDVRLDARVLGFAVAVGLLTSVVFGLVPAAFNSRGGSVAALAGTTRGAGGGGRRIRRILVAGEIALAVVLLTGGGLLLRSYDRLRQVSPGFDDRNVTTFQLSLPSQVYPDAARAGAFVTRLLAGLRATPGIDSAAAAMGVPFGHDLNAFTMFRIAGGADSGRSAQPPASLRLVSDDYFRVMTLPIRRGRAFDARDTADSPEVAVINERFAERYFAGRDPIGQQLLVSVSLARGGRNGAKTIVGVVGNVRYSGLDEGPPAEIYVPYAQQSVGSMTIVVKSPTDPATLVPVLRRGVASLDPMLPLANVKPLSELIDGSVAARRFAMLLVLLFAGVALALAAVGLYGVLAYLVATRASEVGVRLALGATASSVVWLFLREGLWLTLAGLLVGLAAARAGAGLVAGSLFGIAASDPATFTSVALILGTVAVAAMAVPVWRATRVNPTSLLRTDA